ncbi:MAG: hypothetical protein DRN27_01470 [Thermoplasmata archaeon]|nr:MAG: hypothetical protein DRN27_01470 [Thermoplasmata archaeon]
MLLNHMKKKEIQTKFILKKITKYDSLFQGHYTIDPYQNCEFGCIYCDSTYDDTLYILQNALEILKTELIDIPKKRIIIGSVHDPYQSAEETYNITRSIINFLTENNFPIHILTKSPLVLRDIDLLKKNKDVHVTFSFISSDSFIVSQIEKNAPNIISRFQAIQKLQKNNICSGVALIPILPGFVEDSLDDIIAITKSYQASYFLSEHLFLKGDQQRIFFDFIKQYYPTLLTLYDSIFKDSMFPDQTYQNKINKEIKKICGRNNLPTSILELSD